MRREAGHRGLTAKKFAGVGEKARLDQIWGAPANGSRLFVFALVQPFTERPRRDHQHDHGEERNEERAAGHYAFRGPVISLTIIPTTNTTTAPIRLCQRKAIDVLSVT